MRKGIMGAMAMAYASSITSEDGYIHDFPQSPTPTKGKHNSQNQTHEQRKMRKKKRAMKNASRKNNR